MSLIGSLNTKIRVISIELKKHSNIVPFFPRKLIKLRLTIINKHKVKIVSINVP